uniref:Uncharacterized protein n=1 Tax=Noccaea caerulescens TaxID=107243 RepID=A0A1J3G1Q5_NOCCA
MAYFVPEIISREQVRGRKKVYDLVIDDTHSIRVTVTRQPETAHEWVSAFLPVQGTFLTVAVHDEDGEAQVMTLCVGHEALVFKLFTNRLHATSRDVQVFLRDLCSCFGWRTDGYDYVLKRKSPKLYLENLKDISRYYRANSLGDFGMMFLGKQVLEPRIIKWKETEHVTKEQIRETVMEEVASSQPVG